MKKTIITLLVLSGIAMGDTYTYTGGNDGWFEAKKNWTNTETSQVMASDGDMSAAQVQNSFIITDEKTVQVGGNAHHLTGATVSVEGGAKLNAIHDSVSGATLTAKEGGSIQLTKTVSGSTFTAKEGGTISFNCTSNTAYSNLNITVDAASSVSFGNDAKMKDVTINSEAAIKIGNAWIDANDACGNITFNLGSTGVVNYEKFTFNADAYAGIITLNAICQEGFLIGSGDIVIKERTLLTSTEFASKGGTLADFLNNSVKSSITLDGVVLSNVSFDSSALSAEDIGKYKLVHTNNAIKVQYVAYTKAIPEPTTATLSLLALAGLAARRRRR